MSINMNNEEIKRQLGNIKKEQKIIDAPISHHAGYEKVEYDAKMQKLKLQLMDGMNEECICGTPKGECFIPDGQKEMIQKCFNNMSMPV